MEQRRITVPAGLLDILNGIREDDPRYHQVDRQLSLLELKPAGWVEYRLLR